MKMLSASVLAFGAGYTVTRFVRTTYARRLAHVALGRPIIYRVNFADGITVGETYRLWMDACTFTMPTPPPPPAES